MSAHEPDGAPDAPEEHKASAPRVVGFAILAMSDSRSLARDVSGEIIADMIQRAGHRQVRRDLVKDDAEAIHEAIQEALYTSEVDVLVLTGGTGLSPRDVTPEAILPRFDRTIPGFGELFRMLSWQEVGSSAMLSRAEAGVIQGRPVFLLPGSPKACRLAMEKLILPEVGHLVGLLRPETRGRP